MNKKNLNLFLLINILFILFISCRNFADDDILPQHIKKIKVSNFINETSKLGIEELFTNYLIDNFLLNSNLVVVEQGGDAELSGKIIKYFKEPIFYDEAGYITEYRIWLVVRITLFDKVMQKYILNNLIMEDYTSFVPPESPLRNRVKVETEQEAIKRLIKKLTKDIVLKVTKGW